MDVGVMGSFRTQYSTTPLLRFPILLCVDPRVAFPYESDYNCRSISAVMCRNSI